MAAASSRSRLPEQVVNVPVPLRHGEARFVYARDVGDPALERELKGVVVELIRLAQMRLLQMERARLRAGTAGVPVPLASPTPVASKAPR